MKKVILAAFVSGLFLSTIASRAKTISVTGTYAAAVNDTDTTKKFTAADIAANDEMNGMRTAINDTDTTKKIVMTEFVAEGDITGNAGATVSDTDTTKKIMTTDVVSANDDVKTKIDPAALPDAVKTTLAGEEYKGWLIANAYEVKGSVAYYEIELKKGDSKNTVKLDKDGKKI